MAKNDDIPGDYAQRVRALRVEHELTQERLAELLGVSFASVNRWENEQNRPNSLAWEKILRAEKLGIQALEQDFGGAGHTGEQPGGYALGGDGPRIDFSADPDVVSTIVEGHRLSYGHMFNSAFASEISRIDPLPHQRLAVYDHMLPQSRLRFLLADDAGAGKTIMTGLYIREMLSRRLLRRVLIVPPAGLVGNWHHELEDLFSLSFGIATGSDARDGNPFTGEDSDQLIVSVDTLAAETSFSRLQEPEVEPYDLVVFDEAHKLSAHREPDLSIRKTRRYRLGEALAGVTVDEPRWQLGWSTHHLLLLTATPHMGKDFPYYCLWRLLEPDVLSTRDAFNSYPQDARERHFIRRTKEEMVTFDDEPIYPERVSDTLTYKLSEGEVSERKLYTETTRYLKNHYNRASILNRTAAQFAMSIFQRRLASSTYALMRSLERRSEKLGGIIRQLQTGELTEKQLENAQKRLEEVEDVFESRTADEEDSEDGRERNEVAEDRLLGAVTAASLEELQAERRQVRSVLGLARRVYEKGEESKFARLQEVLQDPKYRDEKLIIFTEHRDTLNFIISRLEGIGYTGRIARIHGGMGYPEREEQVEFFRKPVDQGGAQYLVATDAAGEGINLQFCWIMVNYDVPWNPARLEQRMGRIHRYGQPADRVVILNLAAEDTREGRVIKTLTEKLDLIRKELGSDKVFDVVGRLLKDVSIRDYMASLTREEEREQVELEFDEQLTEEGVREIEREEREIYGEGGEVSRQLPRLRRNLRDEKYVRLLPGYVRQFIAKAAPLLNIAVEGDMDDGFSFRPKSAGALDSLWPVLESYAPDARERLTVHKPEPHEECVWLRPGEPVFEQFRRLVSTRFGEATRRGATFIDPTADAPYMFHLALINVIRKADPEIPGLQSAETLESRLVGLKQSQNGAIEECPVQHLLLLKGSDGVPLAVHEFVGQAAHRAERARDYARDSKGADLLAKHRQELEERTSERKRHIRQGYDYREAHLATMRSDMRKKAREGDEAAQARLQQVKERQKRLGEKRDNALERIRREPDFVELGEVDLLAHALAVPTSDPDERKRHDAEVERIAMEVTMAHEEAEGSEVQDVSIPQKARAADLNDWCGFDVLSERPDGQRRAIEVKGRAESGSVELSENEWSTACNLRDGYWLYVVYECAGTEPQLHRVRDPFGALVAHPKAGVIIAKPEVVKAAQKPH